MIKTYYPIINLLRALAALMVCFSHLIGYEEARGSLFETGGMFRQISLLGLNGIYIFFVVSGFVIPLSLAKENYGTIKLPRFLMRRFIRIEIPYFGSIALVYLVRIIYSCKNQTPFELNIEQLIYHALYYIEFTRMPWLDGVYWTLAIEFQFYIFMGLMFILFTYKNKWVMLLSLVFFAGLNFLVKDDDRFVFHYATIFLQGIILFLMKTGKLKNYMGYISIGLCLLLTLYFHSYAVAMFSGITVLVIQFIDVKNKLINWLGDISYSLYLTHTILAGQLLYLFWEYVHSPVERLLLVIVVLNAALILASIFWWFIERPAKKLSKRVRI